MPWILAVENLHVVLRLCSVAHRPEQRIAVLGIYVFVDRHYPFAGVAVQACRAVERSPDLGFGHVAPELDRDQGDHARERLVHRDACDAADTERGLQIVQKNRFHRYPADRARLARRDLADEGSEYRVAPPGDRRDLHESVVLLQVDVAVRLAERGLGLQLLGIDMALDDEFGLRRYQQIHSLRLDDVDGSPGERAGYPQLVQMLGHLLHRAVRHGRRGTDDYGTWHRLAHRLVLLPVQIDP